MLVAKNFFSFSQLTDPRFHKAYNEWHHLDHRPENLVLPGVIWGERWVRTPACAEASSGADPRFARFHYLTMYWFREPLAAAADEWNRLATDSFHWGRRPDMGEVERPFLRWADPARGYASHRVMVTAEVVPIRPHRGVHVTVSRLRGSEAEGNAALHWRDHIEVPALLADPGVNGVWSFVEADGPLTRAVTNESDPLRIKVVWLDADPLAWSKARAEAGPMKGDPSAGGVEEVLFAGPLETILPFQYDWFD